jgi:O-antigen ligase
MKKNTNLFPNQLYAGLLVAAMFYVSNSRVTLCWVNESCVHVNAFADYMIWGLIAFVALLLLIQSGNRHAYWLSWKRNGLLAAFILYSIISISWSVVPERSMHTVSIMVASSISAAVLAALYPPKAIMKILLYFMVVCAVLSFVAVVFFPAIGIHQDEVWRGAWKGIFNHKNDFGPLMALGNQLALLYLLSAKKRSEQVANALFYVFTIFLSVMSQCTTAIVSVVLLHGLTFAYFAWMRWGSKLQRKNFLYVGILLVAGVVVGALAVGAVLWSTGKSLQLTGRIPLWLNLLKNVVSKKPWFGYGLETVWYFPDFQKWAAVSSGWGDQIIVINGHNGYMDILIYLGICGLILLTLFLVKGMIRAVRRALQGRTWLNAFPLFALVYFLVANITIDYILEFESFHWILLMLILFLPQGTFVEETPLSDSVIS